MIHDNVPPRMLVLMSWRCAQGPTGEAGRAASVGRDTLENMWLALDNYTRQAMTALTGWRASALMTCQYCRCTVAQRQLQLFSQVAAESGCL